MPTAFFPDDGVAWVFSIPLGCVAAVVLFVGILARLGTEGGASATNYGSRVRRRAIAVLLGIIAAVINTENAIVLAAYGFARTEQGMWGGYVAIGLTWAVTCVTSLVVLLMYLKSAVRVSWGSLRMWTMVSMIVGPMILLYPVNRYCYARLGDEDMMSSAEGNLRAVRQRLNSFYDLYTRYPYEGGVSKDEVANEPLLWMFQDGRASSSGGSPPSEDVGGWGYFKLSALAPGNAVWVWWRPQQRDEFRDAVVLYRDGTIRRRVSEKLMDDLRRTQLWVCGEHRQ